MSPVGAVRSFTAAERKAFELIKRFRTKHVVTKPKWGWTYARNRLQLPSSSSVTGHLSIDAPYTASLPPPAATEIALLNSHSTTPSTDKTSSEDWPKEPGILNPFMPFKLPGQRWQSPRISLRRQAELIKAARLVNLVDLLPPGPKLGAHEIILEVKPRLDKLQEEHLIDQMADKLEREKENAEASAAELPLIDDSPPATSLHDEPSTGSVETSSSPLDLSADKRTHSEPPLNSSEASSPNPRASPGSTQEAHTQGSEFRPLTGETSSHPSSSESTDSARFRASGEHDEIHTFPFESHWPLYYPVEPLAFRQPLEWHQPIRWVGEPRPKEEKRPNKKKNMFKGHKWERELDQRMAHRADLMRDMESRIRRFKGTYRRKRPDPLKSSRSAKLGKMPF